MVSMCHIRGCVLNIVCDFPAECTFDGTRGGGLCGKHSLSLHLCQLSANLRVATGGQKHFTHTVSESTVFKLFNGVHGVWFWPSYCRLCGNPQALVISVLLEHPTRGHTLQAQENSQERVGC